MFPATSNTESFSYNFISEENAPKWTGIFVNGLRGVQRQVHSSLVAKEDALDYIETLMLRLLASLCASQPHTVQDVLDRVQKTFPDPIDKWAINDAQAALERGGKKNSPVLLPAEKIHPLLVKEVLGYKIEYPVTLYIVAVLEYIAADIFKLTGNYVKNIKHVEIKDQDIKVAICADQVLVDMFSAPEVEDVLSFPLDEETKQLESMTYEEIVKDFILEETQYMRDLNMIIKVFRAPFVNHFPRSKDLEVIFSNIVDIYEFTANLLSSIEDQVEMAAENEVPTVGISFLDLAEEEAFSCYERYVDDMLAPNGKERLYTLLKREDISATLERDGHGVKDAMKYVLPKLLLGPIYHCLHYFEVIKALTNTSTSTEDEECLEQASASLTFLRATLERKFTAILPKKKPWETSLRLQGGRGRQTVVQKMNELQKSIDGWEGKNIWQTCNEFIMEGILSKHTRGRPTDRHVFLFDGLIILCKQNLRRSSVTGPVGEYKLKEKFYIRNVKVQDKEDTEEYKFAFEIQAKDHPNNNLILIAKTQEDKSNWMAALVSLQTRSMLERRLENILREEERQHPLLLPLPELYRFAVEDSEENIVFEAHQDLRESPLIKGGTILKLVERLTYHMYADPKFVRTFLTTYRSFCDPHVLLDLLMERFDIPEPPIRAHIDDPESSKNLQVRDGLKRFRKEYVKPVQFRIVNVLRHWVDHHFYDFERDQHLLSKLESFLNGIKGKAMRKMAESIIKVIKRRQLDSPSTEREFTYEKQPPCVEWHLTKTPEQFDLMTLHPIEMARQVTLLEFELYRKVQPSELVGSVWIKKNKFRTSPNLLQLIDFANRFVFWMEKCIIESENFEERQAVVHRMMEILIVFQELNNFNGVLEVVSALNSAPVHRLEHTFAEMPHKFLRAFNEAKELNSDHFKKYIEKLRSINPPCVPFFGMYLTNILLTEEGNPDNLPNRPDGLINFSKRRKVAEITGEIQQYQNQPYCLQLEPDIRDFFEKLNPLGDMEEKDFNDYLYHKSLEIEPRQCRQPPKFPRKTEYSLKSPGTKPMSSRPSDTRHRFPFPSFSYQRINEEESEVSSMCPTPPTPSTPLTPPATGSGDTAVFSQVLLGSESSHGGSMNILTGSINSWSSTGTLSSTTSCQPQPMEEDPVELLPPPLPPRRNRDSTNSDVFHSPQSRSPELHPPSIPPPPIPPRRDLFGTLPRANSSSHSRVTSLSSHSFSAFEASTLPRTQSLSQSSQQLAGSHGGNNVFSGSLPWCSRERESSNSPLLNLNGDDSNNIPELPPKTYIHSRQQSS